MSHTLISPVSGKPGLCAILFKDGDLYQLITAFPGTLAPPIPDSSTHSPDEYAKYDSFWKLHTFIIDP